MISSRDAVPLLDVACKVILELCVILFHVK
jgi:hypothetical protein